MESYKLTIFYHYEKRRCCQSEDFLDSEEIIKKHIQDLYLG